MVKRLPLLLAAFICLAAGAYAASLRVPAFTAYMDPNPNGARFSPRGGISGWRDTQQQVLWFGEFKQTGDLKASVTLSLPKGAASKFRLTVAGQDHEAQVTGADAGTTVTADFGTFSIKEAGYQKFALRSLNPAGQAIGTINALLLDGPALAGAHFNLNPRRNAASVHLAYPIPQGAKVDWFYNEVTAVEDPIPVYYMACGFHRGYFGMQVNSPTERRIIFSVWDAGNEGVDRSRVAPENLVQLVAKGEGVDAGGFGNEGTGGHSHLVYNWKTGETQRFLLGAKVVDTSHTVYAGFWFHPEKKQWMLISALKAPKDGGLMRGLYSFNEDFGGSNGHLRRKALFGNQWIHLAGGDWQEITTASFSHDPTGKADRLDRFMGVEDGKFFLSNGGFIAGFTPYGQKFTRPATGKLPAGLVLPEIPVK